MILNYLAGVLHSGFLATLFSAATLEVGPPNEAPYGMDTSSRLRLGRTFLKTSAGRILGQ
jgi:hypothetical protein